jgi:hypothetical protein
MKYKCRQKNILSLLRQSISINNAKPYIRAMKLPLILVLATTLIAHTPLHAQRKKKDKLNASFYLYNKDWSAAKSLDDAVYFMESIKENDSLYVCRYYNKLGPIVKQTSFLDSALTMPNGRFCWYNAKGDLDSVGLVYRRRKDNYWSYYRDGKTYLTIMYNKGKLVEKTDHDAKMKYYAMVRINLLKKRKSGILSYK